MGKCRKTLENPFGLTLKQKRFATKYLETGNATEAIRYGYPGVQGNLATIMATENLEKPKIQGFINTQLALKDITPEWVIERIAKETDDENSVIRLKALELLGKHLKLFTEKVDHTVILDKVKTIGWDD